MTEKETPQPEGCEIVRNTFGPRPGFTKPTDEEIIADTKATPVQGDEDPKDR